ncbi:hypothetical protein FRC03_003236 [Tulasnella sp. 419]|nr:hypothetical protein FRC03_003236 [Tulasnella sp. 419]
MPKHQQRKISKAKKDDEVDEPLTIPGDKDHIPRPPNKWILYRSDKLKEFAQMGIPKQLQAKYSKMLSVMWENESPQVKEHYARKSEDALKLHQQQYPDYKYQPKTKAQKVELRRMKEEKREGEDSSLTSGGESKTKKTKSSPSRKPTRAVSPGALHYAPYPTPLAAYPNPAIPPPTPPSSNPTPQSDSAPLPPNPPSDLLFSTSGPMYQPPPSMTLPSLVHTQLPSSITPQWTRHVSNTSAPPSPPEDSPATIPSASTGEGFEFWQTLEGGVDWTQATPSPTALGIVDTTASSTGQIDYAQWPSEAPSSSNDPPPPVVDRSTRPSLRKPKSSTRVLPQAQDASISIPQSAIPTHPQFAQGFGSHSTALMLGSLCIDEQQSATVNPSNLSVPTPSTENPGQVPALEVSMAPNWDGVVMRASDVDGRGLEGSGWWAAYTNDTFSGIPEGSAEQGITINGLAQQDFAWYTGGAGGPATFNASSMDPNSMLNVEMDFSSLVQLLGTGATANDGVYSFGAPIVKTEDEETESNRQVSFGSMLQFPDESEAGRSAPQSRVTSLNYAVDGAQSRSTSLNFTTAPAPEGESDNEHEHYRSTSLNFHIPDHHSSSTSAPRTAETFVPPAGASNVGRRVAGSWRPPLSVMETPASSRAVSYTSNNGVGHAEEWHGAGAVTYFGGGGPAIPSSGGQQYFAQQQQPISVASGSGGASSGQ